MPLSARRTNFGRTIGEIQGECSFIFVPSNPQSAIHSERGTKTGFDWFLMILTFTVRPE
jgi:hypothetical protein